MTRMNTISSGQFARLWADPNLSKAQVAERAGFFSGAIARKRAKILGLPDRQNEGPGRRPRVTDRALFEAMWESQVYISDMARHFGVTKCTIANTRARLGLENRPVGRFAGIKLHEFFAMRGQV